jgi:hypothetical protein
MRARPAITSRAQRCRVHRIPPRVRDDRDTPLVEDETAGDIDLIWVKWERKYFLNWGWTRELPQSPSGKSAGLSAVARRAKADRSGLASGNFQRRNFLDLLSEFQLGLM